MSWTNIKANWLEAKVRIKKQWDALTDDHLDAISGQRDQLVGKIQENYGVHREDADRQVSEWESRNHDLFAETAAEVKKHTGIAKQ